MLTRYAINRCVVLTSYRPYLVIKTEGDKSTSRTYNQSESFEHATRMAASTTNRLLDDLLNADMIGTCQSML